MCKRVGQEAWTHTVHCKFWLAAPFKIWHVYQWHTLCGEAKSVSQEVVDCWKFGPLANIMSEYSTEDIFNCDETGLFYKMEPSNCYMLKGERWTSAHFGVQNLK